MNAKRIDLTGRRFGKLEVLGFAGLNSKRYALWNCRCECGVLKPVRSDLLRFGKAVSCGCSSPRFKPGEHPSRSTEFSKGQIPNNKLPVGSETIRTDLNGKPRGWVKIAEPNKWRQRAVVVWERVNGPLPKGTVIHHKDRDTLNDALDNLECLTRDAHIAEHREDFSESQRIGASTKTWATRKAKLANQSPPP